MSGEEPFAMAREALQASGSTHRDGRKLKPAGLWVKRDQLLDNLRCGIEDAITPATLQGLDRFLEEALLCKPDLCLDCRELRWSEEVCLFFLLFPLVRVAASRRGRFWQYPFDDLEELLLMPLWSGAPECLARAN
jgi:hypothetical protein